MKAARIVATVATIITLFGILLLEIIGTIAACKDNFPGYAGLTIYLLLVQTGGILLFIADKLIRHYWRQK